MKPFQHINAQTIDEAAAALADGVSRPIAGGTDLLGTLKDNILPEYPPFVVNLKSIPGLDYIKDDGAALKIGALTRIADIADDEAVKTKYAALAQAAGSAASPHIRDMGTIGGNIAQMTRCWYFRKAENRFNCNRKGGAECYAILGDNRYHSIFGGKRCHDPSCGSRCPAGTDIPSYLQQLRAGNKDKAAEIIMRVNPMPAITSRVCAHPCQTNCNRCQTDEGVMISGVERMVGDYILDNADKFYAPPEAETGKSVAIVGSGPAGLSAAYYLRRLGNKVTVYDRKPEPGGMLMYAIPAYRLPKDIVRRFTGALQKMGIEFILSTNVGEDIRPEDLEKQYDSVCYSTGAWKRPVVGIAGEELTIFGLDFLVEVSKWMEGKVGSDVLVTGGGNVAVDVAVTAKRLGAKNVTLACLEPRDRMPASDEELARALDEGISVMPSWGLSKVIEEGGIVRGMELKRCVSPWDDTGAFNPQYDESETTIVKADNILMAVGQRVDLSFLGEKYQIQLKRGLIDVAEDSGATSREGVFASGDATTGPATVIGAVNSGQRAARGAGAYLGTPFAPEPCNWDDGTFLTSDIEGILNKKQMKLRELDAEKRCLDLEDSETPTEAEALAEARRCLNCGCYAVFQSDIATALVALDATIVTNKREIPAEGFFAVKVVTNNILDPDEIIMEIIIPALPEGSKSLFKKMAFRKSIDFPIINLAVVTGSAPKVCLGAVAPVPYRARAAEDILASKPLDEDVAAEAGEAAVADASPFEATKYKVQIAKTLLRRALVSLI